MTQRTQRDRHAKNPGGMDCQECGEVFIGEEWHQYCAICIEVVAKRVAVAQGRADGEKANKA